MEDRLKKKEENYIFSQCLNNIKNYLQFRIFKLLIYMLL